jgi:hypothetical protein
MPEDIMMLVEKLKAKYPSQLKEEPLLDEIIDMSYEEEDIDVGMEVEEDVMPMDDEDYEMEEGMEDDMENYEEEDEMAMMDMEEDDYEGMANSPEMKHDDEKKKKDLARRMSIRSKLRI